MGVAHESSDGQTDHFSASPGELRQRTPSPMRTAIQQAIPKKLNLQLPPLKTSWGDASRRTRAFIYFMDNVLAAFIGVTWQHFLPKVDSKAQKAVVQALLNDVFGALFMTFTIYLVVGQFDNWVQHKQLKHRMDQLKRSFKVQYGYGMQVMLFAGFGVAMGSLHTVFFSELWYAITWWFGPAGTSEAGLSGANCGNKYHRQMLWASLGYAGFVSCLTGWFCMLARRQLKTVPPRWVVPFRIFTRSLASATAWVSWNIVSTSLECTGKKLYYSAALQVPRFLLVGGGATFTFFKIIPRWIPPPRPGPSGAVDDSTRAAVANFLAERICFVLFSLSCVNMYFEPLVYHLGLHSALPIAYAVAAAITGSALLTILTKNISNKLQTHRFVYTVTAYSTCYSWWFPFRHTELAWVAASSNPQMLGSTVAAACTVLAALPATLYLMFVLDALGDEDSEYFNVLAPVDCPTEDLSSCGPCSPGRTAMDRFALIAGRSPGTQKTARDRERGYYKPPPFSGGHSGFADVASP